MKNWEKLVAAIVIEEFCAVNHGKLFETPEEFEGCAHRFCRNYRYKSELPSGYGETVDGMMLVPEPDESSPITLPVYKHELSECTLIWEGREPFVIPAQDMKAARHRVSRLVEKA